MNAPLLKLSAAVITGGWMCVSLVAGIVGTHAYLVSGLHPLDTVLISVFGGLLWSSPIFGVGLFLRSRAQRRQAASQHRRPPLPPPEFIFSGIPIGPRTPAPLVAHAVAFAVHDVRVQKQERRTVVSLIRISP